MSVNGTPSAYILSGLSANAGWVHSLILVQGYDNLVGAEGGIRTRTPFRTDDFESSASAIPPPRHARAKTRLVTSTRACNRVPTTLLRATPRYPGVATFGSVGGKGPWPTRSRAPTAGGFSSPRTRLSSGWTW